MRRNDLFWAIVLLLAGAVLLANNFGFISVSWGLLWPAFLILLGAWILFSRLLGPSEVIVKEASIPLEGAKEAAVTVKHGAGRLRLSGVAAGEALASGKFGHGLEYDADRSGDSHKIIMRPRSSDFFFWIMPWNWGPAGAMEWDFSLTDRIPLSLNFEVGASENHLDLEGLKVRELRLSTGASSTKVILPAKAGQTEVQVEAGAASIELQVPKGVAARIKIDSGLAGIQIDESRFPKSGGIYQSPDIEGAANRANIKIETGASSINVY